MSTKLSELQQSNGLESSQLRMAYFRLLVKFDRHEELDQRITQSMRGAGNDLIQVQMASMAIPMMSDVERRDELVDLAVQKFREGELPEAYQRVMPDEKVVRAQINMQIARLYGQTERGREAIEVLEQTKLLVDDPGFQSMIQRMIEQVPSQVDAEKEDETKQNVEKGQIGEAP